MIEKLHGLITAVHTPFTGDGSLHEDRIEAQVDYVAGAGMIGAFVCGTTGESTSLTVQERRRVAERWVASAPASLKVIVQVGHLCLTDAKTLAAHAQEIGADAIAALAPCYLKPPTIDDLVEYCRELAAAAPKTPFFYYHIPRLTGITFGVYDFLSAVGERIPTLCGVKFTHSDLYDFGRCLDLGGGRYQMLFGYDEALLGALAVGATAGVGGTYALAPSIYKTMLTAFAQGDLAAARRQQSRAREMIAALHCAGALSATKAVMKMHGIDCGPMRPPLTSLSGEAYDRLQAELTEMGVLPGEAV